MSHSELLLNSKFKEDLVVALQTTPIVYIQSFNFSLIEQTLFQMASQIYHNPLDICIDNIAVCDTQSFKLKKLCSYTDFSGKNDSKSVEMMMMRILSANHQPFLDKNIFIFKNVHQLWKDPVFPEYLHRIADKYQRGEYPRFMAIVLIDNEPFSTVPSEIEKFAKVLSIPYPTLEDIEHMVMGLEVSKRDLANEDNLRKDLARTLLGLDFYEIDSILRTIQFQNRFITKRSISLALSSKKAIVKKSGLIEVCDTEVNIGDIGGLDTLVADIRKKAYIYRHLRLVKSKQFNMPYPKGVLIIGMPGCGKSLIAKAISNEFKTSLIRLDINKLMGKYVGESEENLRKALHLAETAQPCVLWIDEIEKAFAGANGKSKGDSDMLIQRLMGQFLTWMQERTSAVYVVATANDVMKPEFMRKGRFDEVYFVDFPSQKDAQTILEKKLERYEGKDSIFDVKAVRAKTTDIAKKLCLPSKKTDKQHFNNSFSGSEIECLVNNVIEEAFIQYLEKKEQGEQFDKDYKIKVLPDNFYSHIELMSDSIMANQKAPEGEGSTAIENIRKMQTTYKFKNASASY